MLRRLLLARTSGSVLRRTGEWVRGAQVAAVAPCIRAVVPLTLQARNLSSESKTAPVETETVVSTKDAPKSEREPILAPASVRLNKYLAHNGVATRRLADEMIAAGRVRVNDTVITQVGTHVHPGSDIVSVDGKPIVAARIKPELFIMHKLKGELVSAAAVDARDRDVRQRRAGDGSSGAAAGDAASKMALLDRTALMGLPRGLIAVGGLDYNASGVQLLTTSTAIATALEGQAAAGSLVREYEMKIYGTQARRAVRALRAGGSIREVGRIAPCEITLLNARDKGKSDAAAAAATAGKGKGAAKGRAAAGGGGSATDADRRGWSPLLPGSADADAIAALTGGAIGDAGGGAGVGSSTTVSDAQRQAEEDSLLGDDETPRTLLLRIRTANSVSCSHPPCLLPADCDAAAPQASYSPTFI